MWTCSKCERNFRNINQNHFRGETSETIEEYVREQPEEVQPLLRQLQEIIHAEIPEAKEKIFWGMPTLSGRGAILIQLAASKKYIGMYPGAEAVEVFADRLTEYQTSTGTIRLPIDRLLPLELAAEIARWCEADNGK